MTSIDTPVADRRAALGRWARFLCIVIAALCATPAHPAFAQEGAAGAAAAGADAPPAGDSAAPKTPGGAAADPGMELTAPLHVPDSLWRRADVKTLIANASGKAAGLPAANTRMGLSPLRPGLSVSAPRNAIGVALPDTPPPGRIFVGVTAGTRSTGIGALAGSVGSPTLQMPAPTNAGPALHRAAINGTTMGRMAAGSIGGPAKDHSGINGTLMRPKH